jgi:hypothetical protein
MLLMVVRHAYVQEHFLDDDNSKQRLMLCAWMLYHLVRHACAQEHFLDDCFSTAADAATSPTALSKTAFLTPRNIVYH